MSFLSSFFTGVFSSLTASFFERNILKKGRLLHFGELKKYKAKLSADLSNMPFIYKDLSLKVSDDYVHIEYKTLNADLIALNKGKAIESSTYEILKDRRHILIVGAAGIGKTTFQRYAIYCLLNKYVKADFIHKSENIIPIYIPLKIVDNSKPHPIFRYITSNIDLFKGDKGAEMLIKLAKQKRLFVFLDGYDEMSFMGDNINFAGQEIEYIWHTASFKASPGMFKTPRTQIDFYSCIGKNRVWLASRKEFFVSNPIALNQSSSISRVLPLQFVGIGSNRMTLIKTIFDRYKENSDVAKEHLDEEFFASEIDDSRDQELIELSHNPLFLTVMCFVYCHQVMETKSDEFFHFESISSLILECINLLLYDLDEKKAKELSKAKQKALKKRRNDFTKEKLDFLMFFATELYLENKNTFDEDYLQKKIVTFFSSISNSSNGQTIIQDLCNTSRSNPNFSQQLIYSGLFSLFPSGGNKSYYDFPHRRFRETLTVAQISSPDAFINLLKHYGSPNVSELFELLIRSSCQLDKDLLDNTLDKALRINQPNVVQGFIKCKPENYKINNVVEQFLIYVLKSKSCQFQVCDSVLDFTPTKEMKEFLLNCLAKAIEEEELDMFYFAYSLLLRLPEISDRAHIKAIEVECYGHKKLFLIWYEVTQTYAAETLELMLQSNINAYSQQQKRNIIWDTTISIGNTSKHQGILFWVQVLDYLVNCDENVFNELLSQVSMKKTMLFFTGALSRYLKQLSIQKIKEFERQEVSFLVYKSNKNIPVKFKGEIVDETVTSISSLYESFNTDCLIINNVFSNNKYRRSFDLKNIAAKAASYANAENKKILLTNVENSRHFTSAVRREVFCTLQKAKVSNNELNYLFKLSQLIRQSRSSN